MAIGIDVTNNKHHADPEHLQHPVNVAEEHGHDETHHDQEHSDEKEGNRVDNFISKWPTSLVLAMVVMILTSSVFFPVTRTPGSTSPDFTQQSMGHCSTTHHCVSHCTSVPILPQCLDRVRSVRLLVPTDETADGLQHTEHRKIHPIKLDGFNQNCESNHDWHRSHKKFQKLKAPVTLLLHLIVTTCFPEESDILLAQPVGVVLFTDFYFSGTRPFFHRDVCQQGFSDVAQFFLCRLTRISRLTGNLSRSSNNTMALDTSFSERKNHTEKNLAELLS